MEMVSEGDIAAVEDAVKVSKEDDEEKPSQGVEAIAEVPEEDSVMKEGAGDSPSEQKPAEDAAAGDEDQEAPLDVTPLRTYKEEDSISEVLARNQENLDRLDKVLEDIGAAEESAKYLSSSTADLGSEIQRSSSKLEGEGSQPHSTLKKSTQKKRKAPVASSARKGSLRSAKKTKTAVKKEGKAPVNTEVIELEEPSETADKVLIEDHQIKEEFFVENKLESVYDKIRFQGWEHLFKEEVAVDPEEVFEFYKNVKKEEKGEYMYLHFEYKGQWLTVNSGQLASMFGLEHSGFDTFTKGTWPKSVSVKQREEMQMRVCNFTNSEKTTLSTTLMSTEMRVLHKLLVTNFMPRNSKPSEAQIQDILVLDQIAQKKKINLPKLMIHQMEYVGKLKDVGYARFVKTILEVQLVYKPSAEVSVTKPMEAEVLRKLYMRFNEGEGWVRQFKAESVEEEVELEEVPEPIPSKDLSEEMKAEMMAYKKEVNGMKREFKKLNEGLWTLEDDIKEIKGDIAELREMMEHMWTFMKKGSTSGKGSRI